jgi:hypothetical protein
VKHGTPSTDAFPRKISEKLSPTIARIPKRASPCGACSRDDPHPKLLFTTRTVAPAYFGLLNGCEGSVARSSSNR